MLTGLYFYSKLRKCTEDLVFGRHEGKLETFAKKSVLQHHWKLCAKIPLYASVTNRLIGNYSAKSLEPPLTVAINLYIHTCYSYCPLHERSAHLYDIRSNKYHFSSLLHYHLLNDCSKSVHILNFYFVAIY